MPDTNYLNAKYRKSSKRINGHGRFHFRIKNWQSLSKFKHTRYYPYVENSDEFSYPNICETFKVRTYPYSVFSCDTINPHAMAYLFYDNIDSKRLSASTPGIYTSPLLFNTLTDPIKPKSKYIIKFRVSINGLFNGGSEQELLENFPVRIIFSNQDLSQIGYQNFYRSNRGYSSPIDSIFLSDEPWDSIGNFDPINYKILGDTWSIKNQNLYLESCGSQSFQTFVDTISFTQSYKYVYIGLFADSNEIYKYGQLAGISTPAKAISNRYFIINNVLLSSFYERIKINDTTICSQDSITFPTNKSEFPVTFYFPNSNDSIKCDSILKIPTVPGNWKFKYGKYYDSFEVTVMIKQPLLKTDTSFCEGSKLRLQLIQLPFKSFWNTNGSSQITINRKGEYLAIIDKKHCRDSIIYHVLENQNQNQHSHV